MISAIEKLVYFANRVTNPNSIPIYCNIDAILLELRRHFVRLSEVRLLRSWHRWLAHGSQRRITLSKWRTIVTTTKRKGAPWLLLLPTPTTPNPKLAPLSTSPPPKQGKMEREKKRDTGKVNEFCDLVSTGVSDIFNCHYRYSMGVYREGMRTAKWSWNTFDGCSRNKWTKPQISKTVSRFSVNWNDEWVVVQGSWDVPWEERESKSRVQSQRWSCWEAEISGIVHSAHWGPNAHSPALGFSNLHCYISVVEWLWRPQDPS